MQCFGGWNGLGIQLSELEAFEQLPFIVQQQRLQWQAALLIQMQFNSITMLVAGLMALSGERAASQEFKPSKQIEAVVHTGPGGGSDLLARAIAEMLSELAGETCVVARHGGEEFAALFRGATPDVARASLDRVRQDLERRKMINQRTGEPYGAITFSAGVASAFGFADCRAAFAAADDALYRAKESGRNRIAIASPAQS